MSPDPQRDLRLDSLLTLNDRLQQVTILEVLWGGSVALLSPLRSGCKRVSGGEQECLLVLLQPHFSRRRERSARLWLLRGAAPASLMTVAAFNKDVRRPCDVCVPRVARCLCSNNWRSQMTAAGRLWRLPMGVGGITHSPRSHITRPRCLHVLTCSVNFRSDK